MLVSQQLTSTHTETMDAAAETKRKMDEARIRAETAAVVRAPHLMATPATDAFRSRASRISSVIAEAAAIPSPPLTQPVGVPPIATTIGSCPIVNNGPAPLWHQYLQPGSRQLPVGNAMVNQPPPAFTSVVPNDNNADQNGASYCAMRRTLAQDLVHASSGSGVVPCTKIDGNSGQSAASDNNSSSEETELWRKYLK